MFGFFKSKNEKITESFNHALETAVHKVSQTNDFFIVQEDGSFVLSYYKIIRNKDFTYTIFNQKTDKPVYDNLALIDTAFSVVVSLLNNKLSDISIILKYDSHYSKNFVDMWFAKYSYDKALRKNDEKAPILEDRYIFAKEKVALYKGLVRRFRTHQNFSNN